MRSRVGRILGLGVAAAVGASLLIAAPAQAAGNPAGSHVQILFGSSDPATSMTRSDLWESLDLNVKAGTSVADFACGTDGRVAFAITDATDDGSLEQPAVPTATTLARDVFLSTLQDEPSTDVEGLVEHSTKPGTQQSLPFSWRSKFYTKAQSELIQAGGEDTGVRLRSMFAAGTLHSLVMFCVSGWDETAQQSIVARDASGRAITSWLHFTALASKDAPEFGSIGFEIVDPKVVPTITVTGSYAGAAGSLTASLTAKDGSALTAASGSVDFFNGEGTAGTKLGTSPVSATGTATVPVEGLAAGSHVYTAVYTPSELAASTYAAATSAPFALIVAEKATATVKNTVTAARYGTASTLKTVVSIPAGVATGVVSVTVDGTKLPDAALVAGAASVKLSKTLKVGAHTVLVDYAGSSTVKAASATSKLTIARAISSVSLALSKSKATKKKTVIKATVTVKAPGLVPAGKVAIKVGSKTVKTVSLAAAKKGKIVISLPKFTKTGVQKVTATFATTSTITGKTSAAKSVKVKK